MQSSKDYIRNSSIIHISLVLGQLLFLALSVWVIKPTRDRMYDLHFFVTDAIFVIGGIVIAYLLYIKYARETKKMRGIREKLLTYRKGLIYQWCILKFITIVSIMSYLMTGNHAFIFVSLFTVILLCFNRPTLEKTAYDMELDSTEKKILQTPDAAI